MTDKITQNGDTNLNDQSIPLPPSYIKELAIKLPSNFKLNNTTLPLGKQNNYFKTLIGRKKLITKFKAFFDTSEKGAFLVTGYRGMGKTSFVNKTINEYNIDKSKKIKDKLVPISLTIAQANTTEFDILRQMALGLQYAYKFEKRHFIYFGTYYNLFIKWLVGLIVCGLVLFRLVKDLNGNKLPDLFEIHNSGITIILILTFFTFTAFFSIYIFFNNDGILDEIEFIVARCHATTSKEKSITGDWIKYIGFSRKSTVNYPVATAKEVEFMLSKLLYKMKTKDKKKKYVFIFDELDKLEVYNGQNIYEDLEAFEKRTKNSSSLTPINARKQAVLNIIAGLKNFFTTADAYFVFVAGREMFEASLADISDKHSPLNSMFTYVFHVESLLKHNMEKNKNMHQSTNSISKSSLSTAIEEFVYQQLDSGIRSENIFSCICVPREASTECSISNSDNSTTQFKRYKTFSELEKLKVKDAARLHLVMQSFVTYLLYRSNGSPKKLLNIFHEFVEYRENIDLSKVDVFFLPTKNQENTHTHQKEECFYLYFNYRNLHRLGLINYLYRPFIVQYGRSLKQYAENTIISIPYLFDHLFKFHPFAFSVANLEMVPEILSANKSPYLKNDLKQIIDYMFKRFIRDTDIELFEYKFESILANEIAYISKMYEAEAAAFNFTLDESLAVKSMLSDKIKQLRSNHAHFNNNTINSQIFSIAFLNGAEGDLYFFDQQFDDAISFYSDAIRPINNQNLIKLDLRDFITLVKYKLKIGLCFEKMDSFEEALSVYSDAWHDSKSYLNTIITEGKTIDFDLNDENDESSDNSSTATETKVNLFVSSSISDILQIAVQSLLSVSYIQEKMSLEGITTGKAYFEIQSFLKIIGALEKYYGRNSIIAANLFLHSGKMVFYKNSPKGSETNVNTNEYAIDIEIFKKLQLIYQKNDNSTSTGKTLGHSMLYKRRPLVALGYYLTSLDEVLRSRDNSLTVVKNNESDEIINTTENKSKTKENKTKRLDTTTPLLSNSLNGVALTRGYIDYLSVLVTEQSNSPLRHEIEIYTAIHLRYFANLLSSVGDCILGLLEPNNSSSSFQINAAEVFKLDENKSTDFLNILVKQDENINDKFNFTDVLKCYFLSAQFYKRYGSASRAVLQYKKILHSIKLIVNFKSLDSMNYGDNSEVVIEIERKVESKDEKTNLIEKGKLLLKNLELFIVKKAQELVIAGSGTTMQHMIEKVKDKINFSPNSNDSKYIENNVANFGDYKEIELLFAPIRDSLNNSCKIDVPKDVYKSLIDNSNLLSTQYCRFLELDYYSICLKRKFKEKGHINHVLKGSINSFLRMVKKNEYKNLDKKYLTNYFRFINSDLDTLTKWRNKKLIQIKLSVTEIEELSYYLYSRLMILRILNIYDLSFWLGHSYIGKTYRDLALICCEIQILYSDAPGLVFKNKICHNLGNWLGVSSSMNILNPLVYFQKAKDHFQKAGQLHTAGLEYKKAISNLVFLEDDLNDDYYHFGAAMDKFLMYHGVFEERIKECDEFIGYLENEFS